MNLGNLGSVLAEFYQDSQTIEEAVEQQLRGAMEPALGWEPLPVEEPEEEVSPVPEEEVSAAPEAEEEVWEAEPDALEAEPQEIEAEESGVSVADAMSLTDTAPDEDESAQ